MIKPHDTSKLKDLSAIASDEKIQNLISHITYMNQQLPDVQRKVYLIFVPRFESYIFLIGIISSLILIIYRVKKTAWPHQDFWLALIDADLPELKSILPTGASTIFPLLIMATLSFFPYILYGRGPVPDMFIPPLVFFMCSVSGHVLGVTHWPRNPLMSTVDELVPGAAKTEKAEA
jgi:hypothetical protein